MIIVTPIEHKAPVPSTIATTTVCAPEAATSARWPMLSASPSERSARRTHPSGRLQRHQNQGLLRDETEHGG